ncbi:MAG: sensor histidine kinase [Opitutae bacterium]|nr:sensor histidine kinase [Opitutae bacterium]
MLLLSAHPAGADAVAAFKLGAHDFLVQRDGGLTELVFSLNNALKRATAERTGLRLARELAELNQSLEAQVKARTSELAALSQRLIRIQEDERRHIALELHDQIGQMLTGLRFQIESAQHLPEPAAKLAEALHHTDETIRYVRNLTQQLRPRILDDLGLQPALEWHLRQYHHQTGITVACHLELPEARLPGELETTIFRMVQEALTNIARHARCHEASLVIDATGDHLYVEISDRGLGFELATLRDIRDSLGLAGLQERVSLAGGKLEIHSQPGQGTRLSAEFPQPVAVTAALAL